MTEEETSALVLVVELLFSDSGELGNRIWLKKRTVGSMIQRRMVVLLERRADR